MRIEIICTGDEVLTGATVNTNFSHISQKLGDAGFEVRWGTTVGDDLAPLLDAFQRASMRTWKRRTTLPDRSWNMPQPSIVPSKYRARSSRGCSAR